MNSPVYSRIEKTINGIQIHKFPQIASIQNGDVSAKIMGTVFWEMEGKYCACYNDTKTAVNLLLPSLAGTLFEAGKNNNGVTFQI